MQNPRRLGRFSLAATVTVIAWLVAGTMNADDLTTLSGQTFHAIRPVRVEPDGVTWEHANGVVKVDFADSPRTIRETYHYDAAKATAYHDAHAQARRQADEQTRQIHQANDARQRARGQALARAQEPLSAPIASGESLPGAPRLVYRHGLADTVQAAARLLADQDEARKAQAAIDARNSEGVLGNPKLWSLVPGVGSSPVPLRMDQPNTAEYKASLHHAAGGFAESPLQDDFYNPLYMTKSYYEDVDRANAFARGTPIK